MHEITKEKLLEDRELGLDRLISRVNGEVSRILKKSLSGGEISVEEGDRLFEIEDHEGLSALTATADYIRKVDVGGIVTYVINRNINFTNICNQWCTFCNFMAPKGNPDAYILSLEEVADKTREAWERGATEVCMQGGIHEDVVDGYYYATVLRTVKEAVPQMHAHSFSPFELMFGAQSIEMEIEDFIRMLKDAGLGTIPGTAAEILDEEVRSVLVTKKISADTWVKTVKAAHRVGIRSTSTIMYGHVDTYRHWTRHIALLRDIQKDTGGITEFVPLRFIPWNTRLYKSGKAREGPTDLDQIKMYAVSRLMLRGYINNVQVSWVKQGPEFAQFCLMVGANDFGGTLMEERISRAAGANHGQYFPPEDFRRLITEIGRIPAQRTTTYDIIKVFNNGEVF